MSTSLVNAADLDARPSLLRDRWFLLALALGSLPIIRALTFGDGLELTRADITSWLLFSLVVWQPLLEELIFRGLLQGELLRRSWAQRSVFGVSFANLITSIAFALAHLVYHPPLWAAAVFVPSLVFGFFRERRAGLLAPITLHITYNLLWFTAAGLPAN